MIVISWKRTERADKVAKIERTRNASRNIFFGVILKVYQILVPFLMRTAMIYLMDVQYLGLNSLFASVFQVLNLAELGVGSAMVYSMYKPIAEDDDTTICALMKLYRTYYRVIGLVIAVIGCSLTPFIPHLIKSDVPSGINIYILYYLNLAATVLSYWLFAYKNSIFQAHQRNDVVYKVTLLTSTIQYGLQLFVLLAFHNYYLYVIVALATQALNNIVTAVYADRLYPQFKPKGVVSAEERNKITRKIKDLFFIKIGSVVVDSVDTIVISAFLGLTSLAIYQNYFYIMNSVYGMIGIVFASITAGVGNSLLTESQEKNYNDLKTLTFLMSSILCFCCTCFVGLYQTFMKLWVGNQLMLDFPFVILICIYFYVRLTASIWNVSKDAAGLWHTDRYRALIAATVNLVLNLAMVKYIGLYGILLSTIISVLFISCPWILHNIFKYVYRQRPWRYLFQIVKYLFCTVICCVLNHYICTMLSFEGITGLMVYAVISIVVFSLYLIIFCKSEEMKNSMILVKKILRRTV